MLCNTKATTAIAAYQPVCCLMETLNKLSDDVSGIVSLLWMYRAFESCTRQPIQPRTMADMTQSQREGQLTSNMLLFRRDVEL